MTIDTTTVRRIAHLARIGVDEADLPGITRDLQAVLAEIDRLAEVRTEGVEPMTSSLHGSLRLRPDEVTDGERQEEMLKNASDAREGFYAVPKVVE